jgi:hypothetical protein
MRGLRVKLLPMNPPLPRESATSLAHFLLSQRTGTGRKQTMTFVFLFPKGRRRSPRTSQQFFVEMPEDTQVVGTKDVTLNCRIGNLSGRVQWSKDGFLLGKCLYLTRLTACTLTPERLLSHLTLKRFPFYPPSTLILRCPAFQVNGSQ